MSGGTKMKSLRVRLALAVAVACIGAGCVGVSSAPAADVYGVQTFDGLVANAAGAVESQAGSHPYEATTFIDFNKTLEAAGIFEVPVEQERKITVDLPAGFVGNPTAVPKCTPSQLGFDEGPSNEPGCPLGTQVGLSALDIGLGRFWTGLYNMVPPPGVPAEFGFNVIGVPVLLEARLRKEANGAYAISIDANEISQALPVSGTTVTIWGNPASPAHDPLRSGANARNELVGCLDTSVTGETPGTKFECKSEAGVPPRPFLTNPTSCPPPGVGLETKLRTISWKGSVAESSFISHELPGRPTPPSEWGPPLGTTGCDKLVFEPRVSVQAAKAAGMPSGLDFHIRFPGGDNGEGLVESQLKDATVTLPVGMSLSPSAANGLAGCSDAQFGLANMQPVTCPAASKIGVAVSTTPLLEEPVEGGLYIGEQLSSDPESGDMFRLFLNLVNSERGVNVKLEGKVHVNAGNGQVTAMFTENPQLPVTEISLQFNGGSRAPLIAPPKCGEYAVHYSLSSWSGKTVEGASPLTVGANCNAGAGFTPTLEAGTTNPVGGSYSPFVLRLTRPDGQQNVAALEAKLPEGLLAKLAGVPLCGDAGAATGDCPAASQVGTATVGAGAGSTPIYVPQPGKAPTAIYLAGPYKGAPYSLVVKVPAQAGPFDLGTVAVRNALYVDPVTTQVTAKSDPLPQILGGIPIVYRDIRVEINRPEFTLNPTSCDPMSVDSTIAGTGGASANPSSRFQAASCAALAFAPKLSMSVKGNTNRAAHPAFKAVLTPPPGQANIGRAAVSLPPTEFLENAHIRTVCTRVLYNAGPGGGAQCPAASIYGKAKAWTPLLDRPLEGPVFLRSSDHKLPDLVASLGGQIHIDLDGRIDSVHKRIRNTFEMVPDAPVSRFVLEMQGGAKGLLVNNTELCKTTPKGTAVFTGQHGTQVTLHPVMRAECGGGKGKKKR